MNDGLEIQMIPNDDKFRIPLRLNSYQAKLMQIPPQPELARDSPIPQKKRTFDKNVQNAIDTHCKAVCVLERSLVIVVRWTR